MPETIDQPKPMSIPHFWVGDAHWIVRAYIYLLAFMILIAVVMLINVDTANAESPSGKVFSFALEGAKLVLGAVIGSLSTAATSKFGVSEKATQPDVCSVTERSSD